MHVHVSSKPSYPGHDDQEPGNTDVPNISGVREAEGLFPPRTARCTGGAGTIEEHHGPTETPPLNPLDSWRTSESIRASLLLPEAVRAEEQPLPTHSDNDRSMALQFPTTTEDVIGLRVEVQNLRRVMEQIRVERFESPPEYQDHQYR